MLEIQVDHIIIIIIIGGMFSWIISGTLCLLIDITSLSSQSVNSTKLWANWHNCLLLEDTGQGELCHLYRLPAGRPPPPPTLHPVRGPTATEVSNHHHGCSHGRAHLPHAPSGAAGFGSRLFLPLHLHKREATVGRCDQVCVLHWNWPVSVPPPGLPGPVPGRGPSHQVRVDAAVSRGLVEERQHWLRLAALPLLLCGRHGQHPLYFSHPLLLSVCFLWNPLHSLCC